VNGQRVLAGGPAQQVLCDRRDMTVTGARKIERVSRPEERERRVAAQEVGNVTQGTEARASCHRWEDIPSLSYRRSKFSFHVRCWGQKSGMWLCGLVSVYADAVIGEDGCNDVSFCTVRCWHVHCAAVMEAQAFIQFRYRRDTARHLDDNLHRTRRSYQASSAAALLYSTNQNLQQFVWPSGNFLGDRPAGA
jgi:hypothetical protein